jgi:Tol biopolymer transport system component
VLPPEVAQDPERLGRFRREAQLLAALNHPHIAAIYGLEEANGKPFLAVVGKPGNHIALALSPDEKRVAVQATAPGAEGSDIWTIDLARGVGTRQTSGDANESSPTWSADGREVFFASNREQPIRVYRKTLQGDEPETPFGKSTEDMWPEGVFGTARSCSTPPGARAVRL